MNAVHREGRVPLSLGESLLIRAKYQSQWCGRMTNHRFRLSLALTVITVTSLVSISAMADTTQSHRPKSSTPKLIVQITVDQLRGDLPFRYRKRFNPKTGGFHYLMNQGAWYSDAHHAHSHTETIVGHTTLSTGAFPSRHGMIANSWFDRDNWKQINPIKSLTCIPPKARTKKRLEECIGPQRIMSDTISDLLINANSQSKAFAISFKDRAAVAMAGHRGKAFWFSTKEGVFVSSTYYYPAGYPGWLENLPDNFIRAYAGQEWRLSRPRESYMFRDVANEFPASTPPEKAMEFLDGTKFKRRFPHFFPTDLGIYYNLLMVSPQADWLTVQFAKKLIENESLGQDNIPDYLAISLSSTDIIGHWFSPSSLESEENMLQLDLTLGDLFSYLDKKVGLNSTLIVLAGDHGMQDKFPEVPPPDNRNEDGLQINRINADDVINAARNSLFYNGWGYLLSDDFIHYNHPNLYLDRKRVLQAGLTMLEVERVIADGVMAVDGIALAVSNTELTNSGRADEQPMNPIKLNIIDQIKRSTYPYRSGDVYVVHDKNWQVNDLPSYGESLGNTDPILLEHGSPWSYDSHVPVVFAGYGLLPERISTRIYTVSVAPTIASYLRLKFRPGTVGIPLQQLFVKD